MRELPTVSRDRLLDALCVVERDDQAVLLPDVARAAAEGLPGVSLAFLVTGTARGVAPLRAAASRLPGRRRGRRGAVRARGRGGGAHRGRPHGARHRVPRGPPRDARQIGVHRMSAARRPAGVDRLWPTLVSVLLVMAMLVAAMIPWWPIYESAAFVVASSAAIVAGTAIARGRREVGWPAWAVVVAVFGTYLVLGVPAAVPSRAVVGVLPTPPGHRRAPRGRRPVVEAARHDRGARRLVPGAAGAAVPPRARGGDLGRDHRPAQPAAGRRRAPACGAAARRHRPRRRARRTRDRDRPRVPRHRGRLARPRRDRQPPGDHARPPRRAGARRRTPRARGVGDRRRGAGRGDRGIRRPADAAAQRGARRAPAAVRSARAREPARRVPRRVRTRGSPTTPCSRCAACLRAPASASRPSTRTTASCTRSAAPTAPPSPGGSRACRTGSTSPPRAASTTSSTSSSRVLRRLGARHRPARAHHLRRGARRAPRRRVLLQRRDRHRRRAGRARGRRPVHRAVGRAGGAREPRAPAARHERAARRARAARRSSRACSTNGRRPPTRRACDSRRDRGIPARGLCQPRARVRRGPQPVGALARPARRTRDRAPDGGRRRAVRGGRRAHGAPDRIPGAGRRRLPARSRRSAARAGGVDGVRQRRPPGVDRGADRGGRVGGGRPEPEPRDIPEREPDEPTVVSRPQSALPAAGGADPRRRPGRRPRARAGPGDDGTEPWLEALLGVLAVAGFVVLGLALLVSPFLAIIVAKLRRRRLRRLAPTSVERIEGGWQEFADTAADYGYPIRPRDARRAGGDRRRARAARARLGRRSCGVRARRTRATATTCGSGAPSTNCRTDSPRRAAGASGSSPRSRSPRSAATL